MAEAVGQRRNNACSTILVGAGVVAVVGVVLLLWAKWLPYTDKVSGLLAGDVWSGDSVLDAAGEPGSAPSLRAGWEFTLAYGAKVWKALVAALVIAALTEALLPRTWLLRALVGRSPLGASLRGGLASMPFMMCTCCTAPIAANLRRSRIPLPAALAYWVGNPLLNPAVLVFLALVAPWQWTVLRLVGGIVLTVGATALIGRWFGAREPAATMLPVDTGARREPNSARRVLNSITRMSVTLVPEYLVVVFAVGSLRGWLLPLDPSTVRWGALVVILAAILGTLVVIPTAGEIPVLFGLAAVGAAPGLLGVLLIVLPAVSLPSIIMAGRALSWRATFTTAGAVALVGLVTGGLLSVIGY